MKVRRAGVGMAASLAALAVACGPQNTGGQAAPAGTDSGGSASSAPAVTSPPTLSPQATPSTTTSAGPDRCHTSDLSASLGGQDAGAGNRYAVLTLTNKGSGPCVVFGYGGVGLLGANHKPVPTKQVRDPKVGPVRVVLQPGASAKSMLHWGVVPSGSEPEMGACEPEAAFLQVIPPDETTALTIAFPQGPVCQQGRIDQTAYRAS